MLAIKGRQGARYLVTSPPKEGVGPPFRRRGAFLPSAGACRPRSNCHPPPSPIGSHKGEAKRKASLGPTFPRGAWKSERAACGPGEEEKSREAREGKKKRKRRGIPWSPVPSRQSCRPTSGFFLKKNPQRFYRSHRQKRERPLLQGKKKQPSSPFQPPLARSALVYLQAPAPSQRSRQAVEAFAEGVHLTRDASDVAVDRHQRLAPIP